MILTYNGAMSSEFVLPGGIPQGAVLGGLIFMIKFNGALLRPQIPRPIKYDSKSCTGKYVDDAYAAASIDMKATLVQDLSVRPKPLQFHQRTGHILPQPQNTLQHCIFELEEFTIINNMKLNQSKTNIMMFNTARKWDFPPEVYFQNGNNLELVKKIKLVGVIITEDLKWEDNTNYICEKARRKLWILRRMKGLNLDNLQMLDVYYKEVRSILEMCVPVWHPGLTIKQSNRIERIQKIAFRIILSNQYQSYCNALRMLQATTLLERRQNLCKTFAITNFKSEHSLFEIQAKVVNTRSTKNNIKQYRCNTTRFQKSSLPFLSRMLNDM